MKKYIIAFYKGLTIPNLPEDILKFQLNPIIRVLRVLGGLSTLFLITDRVQYYSLPIYCYIIAMIFTFMFIIYHIYISYHRFKHIRKLLKSDKLDIRNSPLSRLATILSKVIMCAKGACDAAAPIGGLLGFMGGVDAIRQSKGYDPIFLPFLGNIILKDTPESIATQQSKEHYKELYKLSQQNSDLEKLEETVNNLYESKFITSDERTELTNDIRNQKSEVLSSKEELIKKLTEKFK